MAEQQQVPVKNIGLQSRTARIAELRRQYRAGLYRVDEQKLSAKIVDSHSRAHNKRLRFKQLISESGT